MNRILYRIFSITSITLALTSASLARDIYVSLDGHGDPNDPGAGTDWTDAYPDLLHVMTYLANTNSLIYIKGGTWSLTNQISFRATNVLVIGGYEGYGNPGSNNPLLWPTVLSRDETADTTNRIMEVSVANCMLKNLTLTGGKATTNGLSVPATANYPPYGGGLYIFNSSNFTVSGCTIISNSASTNGGGIFCSTNCVNIIITGCVISANTLLDESPGGIEVFGGGIYQTTGTISILNTVISGNRAKNPLSSAKGMAVYQNYGSLNILNCTVAKHVSEGIRRKNDPETIISISNSILWDYGNSLVDVPAANVFYSIVREGEGVYDNTGCFYSDPLFADEPGNDFHLQSMQGHWNFEMDWIEDYANSPAIDAGSPFSDFENETMPNGNRINLGAYGNSEQASRTLSLPILMVSSRLIVTNHVMTNYAVVGHSPSNQPYYIFNSNGYGRFLFYTNVSDSAWLAPTPATGSHALSNEPAEVYASFHTEALDLGTYTGRITVTASDSRGNLCANSPAYLRSIMHVLPPPTMALHPTNLIRSAIYGTNAPSQIFEVWNPTETRFGLRYSAGASEAWIEITPDTGSSYGEHQTLTVNYNVAGLGPGTHTATITVHGVVTEYPLVEVTNSPQHIPVTVTVTRSPGLKVTPTALNNMVTEGHAAHFQTFEAWNNSSEPRGYMSYGIWTDKPWISPEPKSASSTGEHDTINLIFNTTNLASGIYTGNVTVAAGHWLTNGTFVHSADATNSPQIIPVTLTVNTFPEINLNPRGFTNFITSGGNAPSRLLKIWNGADIPRGGLAYVITSSVPWIAASPASGTIYGDASTNVTVLFNTAALTDGNYHGVLTAQGYDPSTGEDLGRININNILLVRPLPLLSMSPTRISHSALQDTPDVPRSIEIWNGSSSPKAMMNFIAKSDQPWLSIMPESGFCSTNSTFISIAFRTAGLAPGIHTATLNVVAWDEATGQTVIGSPRNIQVTLQLLERKPANSEQPTISGLPHIGRILAANPGLWTPPNSVVFTTQWQRADNAMGQSLVDIPGATRTNYVVQPADAGKFIRAKIIAVESSVQPALTNAACSAFSDKFKIRAAKHDFDTDGKADTWFYNPPLGEWRFLCSSTLLGGAATFGWSEAAALPGDYDGDGALDLAVYYQAGGLWYILTAAGEFRVVHFGWWEASPVPADYDGDGITDIAVYYPPTGAWYILTAKGLFHTINFGFPGAMPVPGDYDGDRADDLALYHQAAGNWYALTLSGNLLLWAVNFGWYAALPVPGDFTGDGAMNLAVYDQAANMWYFLINNQLLIGTFGTSNGKGIPIVADFDADGISDLATVHINGTRLVWCIFQSSNGYRGVTYDATLGRWR